MQRMSGVLKPYGVLTIHNLLCTVFVYTNGFWTGSWLFYRMWRLTPIHAPFPVVAARNVHAPFKIDLGYAKSWNSLILLQALSMKTCLLLANFSVFFKHAVSVALFCLNEPWLWKWLYRHIFFSVSFSFLSQKLILSFPIPKNQLPEISPEISWFCRFFWAN